MPLDDLPPPVAVADSCAQRAWDNDICDADRYRMEAAADTIRDLMVKLVRMTNRAEQLEAENETYARALYGNQKGGAA